ncbi:hypothetical protein F5Y15DRAFT_382106 [Xylariaceae sp. FL0016]|nr:hypothetical protein F5Y15DRAFT_382106 [Xylariaceae sp. FL0016]
MSSSTSSLVFMQVKDFVRAELIINCIVVFLVVTVVILRMVGRVIGPGLGWDDAFVIFSTPLGIGMLVCQGLFAPIGNGWDLATHPELVANIVYIYQLTFGMQILYVTLLAAVKVSMLCFFIRVFVTPGVQLAAKITLAAVAAWWIAYLMACIFLCTPVRGQWTGEGHCGAYIPMIQSLIATNALGDLVIMALPMHRIWSLKTRTTDKIGITSCFALGLACVICAIFRLIYLSTVDLTSNITGTMPTTIFLFVLEPNLAILCICIPMLRPFYVMYKKRVGGSRYEDYSNSRSGYGKSSTGKTSKSRTLDRDLESSHNGQWEMNGYHNRHQTKNNANVTAFAGDSDSEKNLNPQQNPRDVIGVETSWIVTRD